MRWSAYCPKISEHDGAPAGADQMGGAVPAHHLGERLDDRSPPNRRPCRTPHATSYRNEPPGPYSLGTSLGWLPRGVQNGGAAVARCVAGRAQPASALLRAKITRRTNAGRGVARTALSHGRGGLTPDRRGAYAEEKSPMKAKVAALVLGLAAAGVLLAPVAGFVELGRGRPLRHKTRQRLGLDRGYGQASRPGRSSPSSAATGRSRPTPSATSGTNARRTAAAIPACRGSTSVSPEAIGGARRRLRQPRTAVARRRAASGRRTHAGLTLNSMREPPRPRNNSARRAEIST